MTSPSSATNTENLSSSVCRSIRALLVLRHCPQLRPLLIPRVHYPRALPKKSPPLAERMCPRRYLRLVPRRSNGAFLKSVEWNQAGRLRMLTPARFATLTGCIMMHLAAKYGRSPLIFLTLLIEMSWMSFRSCFRRSLKRRRQLKYVDLEICSKWRPLVWIYLTIAPLRTVNGVLTA